MSPKPSRRPKDGSEIAHLYRPLGLNEDTFHLIAIDPGDKWTGVAFFRQEPDGWECVDAQEFSPSEFEDALAELLMMDPQGIPEGFTIVYERWRLYADHAMEKTGSTFPSCQHIGVIKYLARVYNEHAQRHFQAAHDGKFMSCERAGGTCSDAQRPMPMSLNILDQVADIKKPTRGILNKKRIRSVAGPIAKEEYGNRDHVKDAELHGWHYILNNIEAKPRPSSIKKT